MTEFERKKHVCSQRIGPVNYVINRMVWCGTFGEIIIYHASWMKNKVAGPDLFDGFVGHWDC